MKFASWETSSWDRNTYLIYKHVSTHVDLPSYVLILISSYKYITNKDVLLTSIYFRIYRKCDSLTFSPFERELRTVVCRAQRSIVESLSVNQIQLPSWKSDELHPSSYIHSRSEQKSLKEL